LVGETNGQVWAGTSGFTYLQIRAVSIPHLALDQNRRAQKLDAAWQGGRALDR